MRLMLQGHVEKWPIRILAEFVRDCSCVETGHAFESKSEEGRRYNRSGKLPAFRSRIFVLCLTWMIQWQLHVIYL
jgi:hypothetical protein